MILYLFNTLCKQATVRLRDCITRQKNDFKKSFLEHFLIKLMNKIHFAQSFFLNKHIYSQNNEHRLYLKWYFNQLPSFVGKITTSPWWSGQPAPN